MRLLRAFFNAVQSAAKSVETVATTVAETVVKFVATTAKKVAPKVAQTAFQLSIIVAVGITAMLILPVILPMILNNTTNTIDIEQEPSQAIAMLSPSKSRPIKQQEIIENGVLITPLSDENLLIQSFFETPLEQSKTEIKEASETDKTYTRRDIEPLNNRLASHLICWQTLSNVSEKLNKIKASELKSIASELQITRYRSLNKTQLMIEIIRVQEEAPAFSR